MTYGQRQYPYDTQGLGEAYTFMTGFPVYDATLSNRTGDGHITHLEERALSKAWNDTDYIPPFRTLFECATLTNTVSMVVLQSGAIPYGGPNPPFRRGAAGRPGVVFANNLVTVDQLHLAIAHEIGHSLGLSLADQDGNHEPPPFPPQVEEDSPNGIEGVKPGPAYDGTAEGGTVHQDKPAKAIMQSGSPNTNGKLPWLHGRWMRHEDWEEANLRAKGLNDE